MTTEQAVQAAIEHRMVQEILWNQVLNLAGGLSTAPGGEQGPRIKGMLQTYARSLAKHRLEAPEIPKPDVSDNGWRELFGKAVMDEAFCDHVTDYTEQFANDLAELFPKEIGDRAQVHRIYFSIATVSTLVAVMCHHGLDPQLLE